MTDLPVSPRSRLSLEGCPRLLRRRAQALRHLVGVLSRGKDVSMHGQLFLTLTEGTSFEDTYAMFAATPAGRRLLETRPDVEDLLRDRAALRACPPGSFGRRYIDFLSDNGFDEEEYAAGARRAGDALRADPRRAWFRHRVELGHDVRHVLSGYGAEVLGEACLLVFRWAQLGHAGAFVLAVIAVVGAKLTERGPIGGVVIEAYRRGRAARRLDILPWELGLATPLSEHWAGLNLAPPVRYRAWFEARALRGVRRTKDVLAGAASL